MKLSSKEREFLGLVTSAAFANPFSEHRRELDGEISGMTGSGSKDVQLRGAIERVTSFLTGMCDAGKGKVQDFSGPDREIIEKAHLFNVFHMHMRSFDALIQKQIKTGDASCPVPFAGKVISQLANCGFPAEAAAWYLGVFYQLRRAYFFIESSLIGQSPSMKQLRLALWNNVFTHDMRLYEQHLWNRMEDFSTLILGQTGTGKGAAATAIGRSGFIPFNEKKHCFEESFTRSFTPINLSQFPETLIESELFGHKKGAFTGAVEDFEGVFSRCSPYGAIFLDEIGDVSVPIQIKLLQVLQERSFTPVGSHKMRRFQGRVIAASNRSIDALRRKKLFRDDFFYRLCSDVIAVPSLAQRLREEPKEMTELLSLMVRRIVGHEAAELVDLVCETIQRDLGRDYAWPGNVRELEQCARRVLLTRAYGGDREFVAPDVREQIAAGITAGALDAQSLLCAYAKLLYEQHGTYEEVSRRMQLDRRTVKKYVVTPSG